MKIAILYICTGKYDIFWKDFYLTAEKYFFAEDEKEYFVFTDSNNIYDKENENVNIIYQENLGWPLITLHRYKILQGIKNQLQEFDYCFFFNANSKFLDYVGREILPDDDEILVVQHPYFYNKTRDKYTYDSNPHCNAYISKNEGKVYAYGAFTGAKVATYCKMMQVITKWTDMDLENGIIAKWHDESYLNKYILKNKYKLLGCEYMYAEELMPKSNIKIIVRDKTKYGGHAYLRGTKEKLGYKIKKIVKKLIK